MDKRIPAETDSCSYPWGKVKQSNVTRNKNALSVIPTVTSRGTVSVPARLKRLDRTQRHAVLATASGNRPHASLMAFALTPDCRALLFATPKATTKHRNMITNSRVSLVIDSRENTNNDYLGAEAITIFGRAHEVKQKRARAGMAAILTRKHPVLREFVDASTTALMLVKIERCLHIGKFQKISEWRSE
jgi:nitroimidazol reductase NimA-like FMN-containing flavoprotein (pyridoxamine 5'-phosphate oxidase superfamily)